MDELAGATRSAGERLLNVTLSDIAPDTTLCVLIGEIDLLTVPLVREKLAEAIGVVPHHLVIDLSSVAFMSSTGLQLLVELRATFDASGHRLALVLGNNRMVSRLLQITGLDHKFNIHTELATAVITYRADAR